MDKDLYEDFRNAMGLDKSEVFQGLVEGFLWAEQPLSIDGKERDPEDLSYSDHAARTDLPLVIDTAAETAFANAAYAFVEECVLARIDPTTYEPDNVRVGIDLWLTISGHGAGFWDGDYGDIGERLTTIARRCMDPWTAGDITTEDGQLVVHLDR